MEKPKWTPLDVRVDVSRLSGGLDFLFPDFNQFLDTVIEFASMHIERCENGDYNREYDELIIVRMKIHDGNFQKESELSISLSNLGKTLNKTLEKLIEYEKYEKCSTVQDLLSRYTKLDKSKFT
jgi:hypothetical protein